MTNDTRIALEKIKPLAYELDINVEADDKFLYCNGQAIGISCNSTYATIMEFLGYAFLNMCNHEYRFRDGIKNAPDLSKAIKRYWFTKEQMDKIKQLENMND